MKVVEMLLKTLALVAAALAVSPAWAVNKCTLPDGKVVFQDALCAAESKRAETVRSTPAVTGVAAQSWEFVRSVDKMTGGVDCSALSPMAYVFQRIYRAESIPMQIGVSVLGSGQALAFVRIAAGRDILHNNLVGMGIKTEPGGFFAVDLRGDQKLAGSTRNTALVEALRQSKSAQLRVRIWPYDDLLDSKPISSSGLSQALAMATECAKK